MNEYSISDYGIFSDAIATTNSLSNTVSDFQSSCSECKSTISNDAVFMGPIADSCVNSFGDLDSNIADLLSNFSQISSYLGETAASYKSGDTAASNAVLNLKSTSSKFVVSTDYRNPAGLSGEKLDFVNSIKGGAVEAYKKYGVLPSLTLAQAILESGWGDCSIGNNVFGIKAGSNWTGKTQNVLTSEQNADGSSYQINADFRDYDSIDDSIVDHAELLTLDRYKPVIDSSNYREACSAVKNCGYATDVSYDSKLINIIETYGLDQWDPKEA